MDIRYSTEKALPCEQLHDLFMAVGWSDSDRIITPSMMDNFNVPFINATIVLSAWADDKLVGCVRVLSDRMFRSVIYDLAVMPAYQHKGIGKELVSRCVKYYPNSEWLLTTETAVGFYEKLGFQKSNDIFMRVPCKYF